MDAEELAVHKYNTKAFIDERPSSIVLTPHTKTRIAGGGFTYEAQTPREEQVFRVIELGMHTRPPAIKVQDGTVREVNFWLLGEEDSVMAIGDRWEEGGRRWEIGDVVRGNGYEQRGLVVEYGR